MVRRRRAERAALVLVLAGGCGRVDFALAGVDGPIAGGALVATAAPTANLSSEVPLQVSGGAPPYQVGVTGRAVVDAAGAVFTSNRPGLATITVTDQAGAAVTAEVNVGGDELRLLGGQVGAIYVSSVLASADGRTWTPAGDLPAGRRAGRAVVYRDRIYYLGGQTQSAYHDEVWASADGQTWTQVGTLPTPQASFGATVHQGEIWIVGGYSDAGDHPATYRSVDAATWQRGPDLAIPAHCPGLVSDGDTLLAVSGHGGPGFLDTVQVLAAGATTWEVRAGRVPVTTDWGAAGTFGDRAYYAPQGTLLASDDLDAWSRVADLPMGMVEPGLVDFRGELLVVGGAETVIDDGINVTRVPGPGDARGWATAVQFTPP